MGELPSNVPPAEKMIIYFSRDFDPILTEAERAWGLANSMAHVIAFFQTQSPGNRNSLAITTRTNWSSCTIKINSS